LSPDSIHNLILYTDGKKPLLEGPIKALVERALRNTPSRHPGLKILSYSIHPERVEVTLDLHRLDEDLARILQLFKVEAKSLAKTGGFTENHLWQWGYEEKGP